MTHGRRSYRAPALARAGGQRLERLGMNGGGMIYFVGVEVGIDPYEFVDDGF